VAAEQFAAGGASGGTQGRRDPVGDDVVKLLRRQARGEGFFRQVEDFEEAFVDEQQAVLGVEQAEALRHRAEGGVEVAGRPFELTQGDDIGRLQRLLLDEVVAKHHQRLGKIADFAGAIGRLGHFDQLAGSETTGEAAQPFERTDHGDAHQQHGQHQHRQYDEGGELGTIADVIVPAGIIGGEVDARLEEAVDVVDAVVDSEGATDAQVVVAPDDGVAGGLIVGGRHGLDADRLARMVARVDAGDRPKGLHYGLGIHAVPILGRHLGRNGGEQVETGRRPVQSVRLDAVELPDRLRDAYGQLEHDEHQPDDGNDDRLQRQPARSARCRRLDGACFRQRFQTFHGNRFRHPRSYAPSLRISVSLIIFR
jgi:hypothetical protein